MLHTAEARLRNDSAPIDRANSASRSLLPQAEVSSVLLVVADIFGEQQSQVALVEGDDVVQQIAPATLHPPLCSSVLPKTPVRRPHRFDPHRPHRGVNFEAILRIPVKDQKSGNRFIREGLPQLLYEPGARGTPSDIEMQDTSPSMANDEKTLEQVKCDGWNGEEIHGRDHVAMVAEKSQPPLGEFRIATRTSHPAGDGSFGNVDAQDQEFTVNARRAPSWILLDHAEDQISSFLGDPFPPNLAVDLGDGTPIE